MADEVLVRYGLYPQDSIEVDTGLGESFEPDKRFETFDASLGFLENFFCNRGSNFFYMIQITFITDSDRD